MHILLVLGNELLLLMAVHTGAKAKEEVGLMGDLVKRVHVALPLSIVVFGFAVPIVCPLTLAHILCLCPGLGHDDCPSLNGLCRGQRRVWDWMSGCGRRAVPGGASGRRRLPSGVGELIVHVGVWLRTLTW